MLNEAIQINDFMEDIIKYIDAACIFIKNLLKTEDGLTPFQMDVCVAVGKSVAVFLDDDDDDDDDKKEDDSDYADCIGDFEQRIKANDLKYVKYEPNDNERFTWRDLLHLFRERRKKVQSGQQTNVSYPHKKRLILFIDRRTKKNNENIYLYEPPQGPYTRDIPDGYIAV